MSKTPPEDDIAQLLANAHRDGRNTWAAVPPPKPISLNADGMAVFVEWSRRTFGPDALRTEQLTAHIRKELAEILADPTDTVEWVDVMILAFDGAWRTLQSADDRESAQRVLATFHQKMVANFERSWPDWRTVDASTPVEHVREETEK